MIANEKQESKILELLGVTFEDIQLLNDNKISLEEVLQKRVVELQKEAREVRDIEKICNLIIDKKIDMSSLLLNIENEELFWEERLEYIKRKDCLEEDKL